MDMDAFPVSATAPSAGEMPLPRPIRPYLRSQGEVQRQRISSETLANQAEATGFRPDMLEMEFLNRVLDKGEITPGLLTADEDLQDRIRRHPLLEWKALNVRACKR